MILLMLSLRTHRKKPYPCDEEENVHENIVRYDDEGGGEEDTEAFDIAAMWNPCEAHRHANGGQGKTRVEAAISGRLSESCGREHAATPYLPGGAAGEAAKLRRASEDMQFN